MVVESVINVSTDSYITIIVMINYNTFIIFHNCLLQIFNINNVKKE